MVETLALLIARAVPLGIAFELRAGDRPMDRVPAYVFSLDPWGGDPQAMVAACFGTKN